MEEDFTNLQMNYCGASFKQLSQIKDEDENTIEPTDFLIPDYIVPLTAYHENIQILSHVLNNLTDDVETAERAISAVYHMSFSREGRNIIYNNNGIIALVRLLDNNNKEILLKTISTLHNLLLYQDGAITEIRLTGGLQKFSILLQSPCMKFLAVLTDCIRILVNNHEESKVIVLSSTTAPSQLVRILTEYEYEKVLLTTCRLLKKLSACFSNRYSLVSAGCIEALVNLLSHSNKRLVRSCLWIIRNLSDVDTIQDTLERLFQPLVQFLLSNDPIVVTYAAGILSNLTCNNPQYKLLVYELGGIKRLLQAITQAEQYQPITEPAVRALRHLTSQHEGAILCRTQLRLHQGIPILFRLLRQQKPFQQTDCSFMKAITGVIKNLTLDAEHNTHVCDEGDVHLLLQQLIKVTLSISNNSRLNVVDAENTIENILWTIYSLPLNLIFQIISQNLQYHHVLVSLSQSYKQSIVHITTNILKMLLVKNNTIAVDVDHSEVIISLNGLLRSTNEFKAPKAVGDCLPCGTDTESVKSYTEFTQVIEEFSWDSYLFENSGTTANSS